MTTCQTSTTNTRSQHKLLLKNPLTIDLPLILWISPQTFFTHSFDFQEGRRHLNHRSLSQFLLLSFSLELFLGRHVGQNLFLAISFFKCDAMFWFTKCTSVCLGLVPTCKASEVFCKQTTKQNKLTVNCTIYLHFFPSRKDVLAELPELFSKVHPTVKLCTAIGKLCEKKRHPNGICDNSTSHQNRNTLLSASPLSSMLTQAEQS